MEPKFQTSFIPKNPINLSSQSALSSSTVYNPVGFLASIGTILFVLSLIGAIGLFGYEKLLNSQIDQASKALVLAQSSFDPDTLQTLISFSERIKSAKNLINTHVAVSNMFAVLQDATLPKVTFKTFTFTHGVDGVVTVSLEGEAASYAVVAQQASIWSTLAYLTKQSFSELGLSDTGSIKLKFQTTINPKLVSYVEAVNQLNVSSTLNTQQVTASSTDTNLPTQ